MICDTFGAEEGKCHGYPGHQEIELALVRLYQVTEEKKYLDLAYYFINRRGVGENHFLAEEKRPGYRRISPDFNGYDTRYSQSHLPVREQLTAVGHAVRAVCVVGLLYRTNRSGACKTELDPDKDRRYRHTAGNAKRLISFRANRQPGEMTVWMKELCR